MSSEISPEFNLLYEPWIAVLTNGGDKKEISLCEVYKSAQAYRSLAGELPAQNTAVLRLLLAVLHSAYNNFETAEEAEDFWVTLWQDGSFRYEAIVNCLRQYEDRFWLFHPDTPFFQIPGLDKRDDVFGPFNIAKLNGELSESDNKARFIPQRSGYEKTSLSYSEAARWLLYYNGFAETFGKLESKCKRNKSDMSLGVGWLGKLGLISAYGDNLFQTLMLNFVPFNSDRELWKYGQPIWEKPVNIKERNIIRLPGSQAELLTLQSRRVQLEKENGRVTSFRFVSGDVFAQEESFSEQMTTWRYSKQPGDKTERYRPKKFWPSVQLWRDFASLVAQDEKNGSMPPGVVWWSKHLVDWKSEIFNGALFKFQTSGISYGTMQAVITDVFDDSLSFNSGLLSELKKGWLDRIIAEIHTTDNLVYEVSLLAQSIEKAAGTKDGGSAGKTDGQAVRDEARTQAYYSLDVPFRLWLEKIDPQTDDMDEKCDEWWNTSQSIIRSYGWQLANNCSPKALIGNSENSAPKAYNWFLYKTKNREILNRKGGKSRGGTAKSD